MSRADELFGLGGKTAVVTGANRGIGRTIALELARMGASVVVVGARNIEAGQAVVREIESEGGRAIHQWFELEDESSIAPLMRRAVDAFGRLDILVNNAGIYPPTALLDSTTDQLDAMFNINFRGAYLCLREAAKAMREHGHSGAIVNISSMGSGLPAAPGRFAYNASKASLNRLTQDAAAALAADGIRVNAVLPGPIEVKAPDPSDEAAAKLRAAILRKIKVGRYGVPADIAAAVVFLCGPASSYITGRLLVADGGFTLG